MDSLHGPNTLKQSCSIALSRLGYDIQVKSLDPFFWHSHVSNSQPSNLENLGLREAPRLLSPSIVV